MKAVVRTRYGGPEILSIEEIPVPTPSPSEVLVKVHFTTVNRTDCSLLTGKPFIIKFFSGLRYPTLQTTGTDFSGEVVAVGADVTAFKLGDRVFGLQDEGLSSHAEYLTISQSAAIARVPDNVSLSDAAASAEGAHYALNFINKVKLNPGDQILVNGATGAIGSAAIQLLLIYGVTITAVCGTKNTGLIKSMGVEAVIDYQKEDFTKLDQKFDFILDTVGKSRFKLCKHLLKPKGIYVSSELGPKSENLFLALSTKFSSGKKVIFPFPTDIRKSIQYMASLLEEGKFEPVIDRIYPLNDIAEAFGYVLTGYKTGNVLLKLST